MRCDGASAAQRTWSARSGRAFFLSFATLGRNPPLLFVFPCSRLRVVSTVPCSEKGQAWQELEVGGRHQTSEQAANQHAGSADRARRSGSCEGILALLSRTTKHTKLRFPVVWSPRTLVWLGSINTGDLQDGWVRPISVSMHARLTKVPGRVTIGDPALFAPVSSCHRAVLCVSVCVCNV